jgi:hypothetical protein
MVVDGFSKFNGMTSGLVEAYQILLLRECPHPPADSNALVGISRIFFKANCRCPTVAKMANCKILHPCSVQSAFSSQLFAKVGYN